MAKKKRRSDQVIAEQIVDDVVEHGPGSAAEIAASVDISVSRFYAVMCRAVNEAAERKFPGHRIMPRRGKEYGYALVRKYRACDPQTVLTRCGQATSKNHRLAVELDVADAGPIQRRLAQAAMSLAMQSDFLHAEIADWVDSDEVGALGGNRE